MVLPLVLAVIPARYQSTRFPGKALAPLGNKTLLEQVWQRTRRATKIDRLIVATDDARIESVAQDFGAEVMMTASDHPSGTDRVAEIVGRVEDSYDVIVNVQGDEPLLTPESLDRLVEPFEASPKADAPDMTTLSEPIEHGGELFDPNVVKIAVAENGLALYFSRSPIPYHRGDAATLTLDFSDALARRSGGLARYRKHQGIYAFTRETLLFLTGRDPSPLEQDEGLEQLRALEAGRTIRVIESDYRSMGVDTPADLKRVQRILTEAN